jgi:hypothetical protein
MPSVFIQESVFLSIKPLKNKVACMRKWGRPYFLKLKGRVKISMLLLSSLPFLIVACNSEESRMREEIQGKWDVYSTEMNNIPNGLMQNGWFEFLENGDVSSNIFSDNQQRTYELEEGKLTIAGPDALEFSISKLQNDTLHLEGQLGHYFMRYYLVKKS